MAVSPGAVVEYLDVLKYVGLGQIAGSIDLFSDFFLLEAAEE